MKNFKGIEKIVLENGLTVLMEKVPGAKKASLLVGGMSGSVHEIKRFKKLNGGSHFNEHLLFKSNKHRTAAEINETLEYGGADVNAYTSNECTAFYVKSLPSNLNTALDIIFEATTNFEYDQEEFDRERKVVLTEINMRDEDHFSYLDGRIFSPALFKGSPYEQSVAGTTKTMGEVTKKELEDFKKEFYVPNNMAVVVTGKFDKRKLLKKIKSTFGTLEPKELPPHDWSVDLENQAQELIVSRDAIEQTYLLMGNKIPIVHEDAYKLVALKTILSGGLSSRFFKELREERGIGYGVGFYTQNFKKVGQIGSYIMGFDSARFDEARETILNEYHKIKSNLVPEAEFKGRLNHGLSRSIDSLESISTRCQALFNTHLKGTPFDYRDIAEHMAKVTRQDVMDVANKYLENDKYVLAALIPRKD